MKTIYLAGGCFWGVENYFQNLSGVIETKVGYINSFKSSPSYLEVSSGQTGATEGCKIIFNELQLSLPNLLKHLFIIIDPTTIKRQGNDIGSQYRTGIYPTSSLDIDSINLFLNEEQKLLKEKIVVEVKVLENFYLAEESHQNYLIKNPSGYCHCLKEIEDLKNSSNFNK